MVAISKGMVQVSGTTYRIVQRSCFHEIVRILDDRIVGAFRHELALELVESGIAREELSAIVRQAYRVARLSRPTARQR